MSTIQQLKNFIRHGKQARATNGETSPKQQHSPPQKAQVGISEPAFGAANPLQTAPEAYSVAGDDQQNRAAQAGHAAAHAVEPNQNKTSKAGKNIDNAHLAKLIAEENESKSKFPKYPGLERWQLLEKMGDGAFSNVYRARDTTGEYPSECAIKVVRKYEMNSMQKKAQPDTLRAFDASRIVDGDRRYDFRSPGAVNLREVFDVGYAVHRQEEEAKRRKQVGTKGGGVPARFLNNLNEESEDEDEEMAETKEAEYVHKPSQTTQALENSMRNAQIRDQQEQQRGRERERQAPINEKGYGQHSAAVTAAARQQVRDRNRQKGAFELSLDGATLLGRRNKQPLAAQAGGA
ncbi:hypothetical protein CSUB01_10267 [Colletotrichum sublineola]|uniref:Protein kinase domain-containing protein n=1 Tax=Colletotrichum sublineola TaxID=1173701 RepID=A0A066XMP3_COLSU|nr:hypothetical protein CSUB01_10267 [Colletotrichum sublineola]